MFEVISRIPGDTRVAAQKSGTPSSASAALYDQILRSVLRDMESAMGQPAVPVSATAIAVDEAPVNGVRTLEDVMMQRQFICSLNEVSAALPLEELALQQQPLTPTGAAENAASNPLLEESLAPWELLMGHLTLQQRLAR